MEQSCPIWGTPATIQVPHSRALQVVSPRAGGAYKITFEAMSAFGDRSLGLMVKLTNWLVSQWLLGVEEPLVTDQVVNDMEAIELPDAKERADRFLAFLARESGQLGVCINIPDNSPNQNKILAWSGSTDNEEYRFLGKFLEQSNFIEVQQRLSTVSYMITVEGHLYLAQLKYSYPKSDQAFVAMWFDQSMDQAWREGIELGIRDAGYEPLRIDGQEHNEKIDDRIVAEIKRSRFLVADFTHGATGMRGGVYYEAGLAHGLGLQVIFMCREDMRNEVHFDTRQYNHILWNTPAELREKLANRISATIGDGPKRSR